MTTANDVVADDKAISRSRHWHPRPTMAARFAAAPLCNTDDFIREAFGP